MTAKGEKQRPWTPDETIYLINNAGKISVADLCKHLKCRTAHAVICKASYLGVSVRYKKSVLTWCDACAKWRSSLDANGQCPVCRLKQRLEYHEHSEPRRSDVRIKTREALKEEAKEIEEITRRINRRKQENRRKAKGETSETK